MSTFTPFEEFEKDPSFPAKSSRVPCKDPEVIQTGINPADLNLGLLGQVSGWIRPMTGEFPVITISSSNSVLVPSGTGYIVNPETGIKSINWNSRNIVLARLNQAWITTIAVNESNEIVQLDGNINPEWARTYIILGTVTHINAFVDAVQMTPAIWGAAAYAAYDLAMANRNTLLEGGSVHPSTTAKLSLDILPRKMFFYGAAMDAVQNPNFIQQDLQPRISFFPVTGNSSADELTANLPVTKYNPNGTGLIQTIPGDDDEATAFRLYQLGDRYLLLYGQYYYSSLQECIAQAPFERIVYPTKMPFGKLLAIICVRRDAVDLRDPNDSLIITNPPRGDGGNVEYDGFALHFFFEGDGVKTDFFFPGANSETAEWYDTYLEEFSGERNFIGQEPNNDYSVELGEDPELGPGAWFSFSTPPGEDIYGFSVLRGQKRPASGPPPVDFRLPIINVSTTTFDFNKASEFAVLRCTNISGCTITIPEIPAISDPAEELSTGSYFSATQRAAGQIEFVGDGDVIIKVPSGLLPKTRATDSTISAYCEDALTNTWVVAGDLEAV